MELGGNERWRKFWEEKTGNGWDSPGRGADRAAAARLEGVYGGEVGEEWKERLGCEVEGREFTGMPVKERRQMESKGMDEATGRTSSPMTRFGKSQKEMNENFFARKGDENASRPEGLRPSEGGKYGGFGSEPMPPPGGSNNTGGAGMPGVDEFQKDPVAALSKGFGWFTGAVGKGAKSVNDGWIQPTAQKVRLPHVVVSAC